jgi:hypothetical protein
MYRGNDGLKCAIGCLIPDDVYDSGMEHTCVDDILISYPSVHLFLGGMKNSDLLDSMRCVHDDDLDDSMRSVHDDDLDDSAGPMWDKDGLTPDAVRRLRRIAKMNRLSTAVLTELWPTKTGEHP